MDSSLAGSPLERQLAAYGEQLHEFLEQVPAYLRRGQVASLRGECGQLLERAPVHKEERWLRVHKALGELRQALDRQAARAYVLARYEEAARAYEQWIAGRQKSAAAAASGSLKPLKIARTAFHIANGLFGLVMYQFFLSRWQATAVLASLLSVFVTLEVTRRLSGRWNHFLVTRVFAKIARPHEYTKVNSATWFLLSLCLLVPVFSRPAVLVGLLVLSFADPAAAWFGKTFGKRKLYGRKSLVGTLAFLATGALVASAFLLVFYPGLPLSARLLAAGAAALVGAVTELFTSNLDDNLTIPVAAVVAAAIFI
ncbi:MAG: diacylglycerol/polyprenol kinase family protein [Myxococcaceae bacterium]